MRLTGDGKASPCAVCCLCKAALSTHRPNKTNFNAGDFALDVQDNVTSVVYNANNDVFTFVV